MNNKFISLYSIISFIGIFFSIILFVFTIRINFKNGNREAEKTFISLSRELNNYSNNSEFDFSILELYLTEFCENSDSIVACSLKNSNTIIYDWNSNKTNILQNIYTNTSLFTKAFSSTFYINNSESIPIIFTCVLYSIQPEVLFNASRVSFIILLFIFGLSIIILYILPKQKESSVNSIKYQSTKDLNLSQQNYTVESNIENNDTFEKFNEEINFKQKTKHLTNSEPLGLYTKTTGLGWEEYLEERLNGELERATSLEQDLTLLIIKIQGILHTDFLARKIADYLLQTFKFKDLIFEFDKNGFAAILHDTNLYNAMSISENVLSEIESLLKSEEIAYSMAIGLSNRSARLIPASKMITEALSAVQKAQEEQILPIVAYRTNQVIN